MIEAELVFPHAYIRDDGLKYCRVACSLAEKHPTTLRSSTRNLSNGSDLIFYYHYISPPFSPPKSTATSNTGKKIKPVLHKNMLRELNTQDVAESRKLYLAKKIQSRVSHDENTTLNYIYTQH